MVGQVRAMRMADGWRRRRWGPLAVALAAMFTGSMAYGLRDYYGPWLLLGLGLLLVFYAIVYWYLSERLMRGTWSTQNKPVGADPEAFLDAMEGALGRSEFAPVSRSEGSPNVLDLRDGLFVSLSWDLGRFRVAVGPDRRGTHDDVERLKGLIDDVLRELGPGKD